MVADAGMSWDQVEPFLSSNSDAVNFAAANRHDLEQLGMWGVPAFRYDDFSVWGQDRLEILANHLPHSLCNKA